MSFVCSIRDFCDESRRYRELADRVLRDSKSVIVNGHNFRMSVRHCALHIQHGTVTGEEKEPLIYYRGTVPINRIIILARSGNITIEALYWCKEQGISILMLDGSGNMSYSIVPENKDSAPLRRLQYRLSSSDKCSDIAVSLLSMKTAAQLHTVTQHTELKNRSHVIDILGCGLNELDVADYRFKDMDYVRMYEARLASEYFSAYMGLPIRWRKSDEKIVPPHWQEVTERTSPLSPNGNARKAVNPFHVALNYLYGVAEHQLLCAVHSYGLDPACGFLHADKENRLSLLYDLVEPHRAEIDDKALTFFRNTVLRRGNVTLFPSGQIALNAEFSRYLVASCILDDRRYTDTVVRMVRILTGT